MAFALVLSACVTETPEFAVEEPVQITLIADGEERTSITEANNVREYLAEIGLSIGDTDMVDPPIFTPLTDGLEISVIRVSDSIEVIEQTIPYQRRNVRNESMSADSEPIIVQSGRPGRQEYTVRIIYHDGLEFSRQQTKLTVLESAQDEIVMIGVGSTPGDVDFPGQLAIINGGNAILLRGSSAFAEQLEIGGVLDHRVFSLSPTGSHLMYTRVSTETGEFNTLWVVSTVPNATPKPLDVENVLWAEWNPDRIDRPQIAFTTGVPTDLLPGWEANNDLWTGDLPLSASGRFRPRQLIESYPATYGWWGGNYAWSPVGRHIAYSYADEVGVIDLQSESEEDERKQLQSFSEYNTRGDWVWVPSLSWSPDGGYLAFTKHASEDPDVAAFDTWAVNIETGLASPFIEDSGIWSHPLWSPPITSEDDLVPGLSQIAFLKAINPVESQRSSYALWRMDRDGSNAEQIFPAAGENSRFPREQSSISWAPTGQQIAFVYDDDLFLYDTQLNSASQVTFDDNAISNPTWSPYGKAAAELLKEFEESPATFLQPGNRGDVPPE